MGLTKTDTRTVSATSRAFLTSIRCPSCSAPMVGTKPMEFPAPFTFRTTALSLLILAMSSIFLVQRLFHLGIQGETLLEGRERPLLHVGGIPPHRPSDHFRQAGVGANEGEAGFRVPSEHVMADEDLPVAAGAGADPDGGDAQAACEQRRDRVRHPLQHDPEA